MIPIETAEDLADTLHLLRRLRGMSQADVDARSGICFTRISRYERARSIPDVAIVLRLLAALGYRLAAVPLVDTAPETALSVSVTDREAEIVSESRVDDPNAATRLSGGAA